MATERIMSWPSDLRRMVETQESLEEQRRWPSPRRHLLGVIGRARRETYHSAILAWLLDPKAPHGLRSAFLDAFLERVLPSAGRGGLPADQVKVGIEVCRSRSRADVVIWIPDGIVVIEMKLDAGEQDEQCGRLHADWGGRAKYVFLTPDGHDPHTDIGKRFQPMSFRGVSDLLRQTLETSAIDPDAPGLHAVRTYAETLHQEFFMSGNADRVDDRVAFFLEHRDRIEEWAALRLIEQEAAYEFFASVETPLRDATIGVEGNPEVRGFLDGPWPKILQVGRNWSDSGDRSMVAIGLEWERSAGFRSQTFGVWINAERPGASQLHQLIRGQARDHLDPAVWAAGFNKWWPVRQTVRPDPDFWTDLPAWRNELVKRLMAAWGILSPVVQSALDKWSPSETAAGRSSP